MSRSIAQMMLARRRSLKLFAVRARAKGETLGCDTFTLSYTHRASFLTGQLWALEREGVEGCGS